MDLWSKCLFFVLLLFVSACLFGSGSLAKDTETNLEIRLGLCVHRPTVQIMVMVARSTSWPNTAEFQHHPCGQLPRKLRKCSNLLLIS